MRVLAWVAVLLAAGVTTTLSQVMNDDVPRVYRIILPVNDIERAAAFYGELLGIEGVRVSPGRHYFHGGGMILAVADPSADGDGHEPRPNQDYVYFAVKDLEAYHARATKLGALSDEMGAIEERPWGEVSFYVEDPFGNPLCFVDEATVFTGR